MTLPIIYAFSGRWDETPARQRYLMEAMSVYTQVIFLNSPRLSGRVLDVRKPRVEKISEKLTVVHDAFGFRSSRLGKKLGNVSSVLDARWLHSLLRGYGITEYIYWLSAPKTCMLRGMRLDKLVYDCIDPCFDLKHQAKFDQEEHYIVKRARLVFCTAETLLDRVEAYNKKSFLLPNACSLSEYIPANNYDQERPVPLKGCQKPVIGYMGTFDARVDIKLLHFAASSLPQYMFALVGRINADIEPLANALRALPNVVMPGAVSVQEGRAYTSAFDVGLIPFKPGPMNDAVNPVKMYMYLASGIPVVSTDLREPTRIAPLISVGRTPDEFIDAIVQAASFDNESKSAERIEFARRNTWEERAREAIAHLKAQGLLGKENEADLSGKVGLCH